VTQLSIDFLAPGTAGSHAPGGACVASPRQPGALSVDERAARFHTINPSVFDELRQLALTEVGRGVRYISIARLFETLRIRRSLETQDPSGFRLNNSYRAFFARRLMAVEPRLVGVFRLRDRACDKP
jgi:hypothetical protein